MNIHHTSIDVYTITLLLSFFYINYHDCLYNYTYTYVYIHSCMWEIHLYINVYTFSRFSRKLRNLILLRDPGLLGDPAETPKSGFPSTGPLCGAFNRCIFLLRDFGNWEMLSKSHFLVPKTAWNDLFFLAKIRPRLGGPFSRKNPHCVPGGKLQLSIIPGSTGAWKYSEIFLKF